MNKNLLVIAVIAVVNALGYGIIIPILYSYSQKFGLSDFQNGLLFAVFSLCQFIATPTIGRLSDKYGRKPLLLLSIGGTAISFLLMAFAPNAIFLFLARALDGITAGNIPVAQAVISDSTNVKDRAKGFGIIGASFGFGFIFGPAISAFTYPLGPAIPFLIAAAVAVFAVILTAVILPETNMHRKEVAKAPLLDFSRLIGAAFDARIGETLILTLIYSTAFSLYLYAYQPFSVKVVGISTQQISINFIVIGLVGLITQVAILPRAIRRFGEKQLLPGSLWVVATALTSIFLIHSFMVLITASILFALANSFINPLVQAVLSREVDAASQGSIMGLNASYLSVGMIIGPLIGGAMATLSVPSPFIGGAICAVVCALIARQILHKHQKAMSLLKG